MENNKKKICVVVTAAMNLWSLYRDQFLFLQENGFEVTAIAGKGIEHEMLRNQGIKTFVIPMVKNPAVIYDLFSFIIFIFFFIFNRFDIVSISTPKASLLAGFAAFITRQKKIIFTLRGRAYENKTGIVRLFYNSIDKLICNFSNAVFCISKELMFDFVNNNLCCRDKIFVIGSGSSNGVDLQRFTKTDKLIKEGNKIRSKFGIGKYDVCILYSGRIRKDKGINELIKAFDIISKKNNNVHLILQGEYELSDPLEPETIKSIEGNKYIHKGDWCSDVQTFFSAADIFAFPSHREGFGNVAIEASAMELPVVAFDVIGCRESIVNQKTGILCPFGNYQAFAEALEKLINNKNLRIRYGLNGRKRIEKEFDCILIWETLLGIYNILCSGNNIIEIKNQLLNCNFVDNIKFETIFTST